MLVGLLAVRVVLLIPIPIWSHQLAIGVIWLVAAFLIGKLGFALSGVFLTLSGLSYAVLLIFGQYIRFMGLVPIVADAFWILALLSITVGGNGHRFSDSGRDRSGDLVRPKAPAVVMAAREEKRD
ncbi:hypothetical protein AB3Y40_06840 [Yoonia sp. R2331]|uniref:hypothetical protein n=1 Tax=Yoonia sp. R2331 TaxID=3237238 RepID=UPI0034E5BA06